ncbi:hypothetical protein D3C72_1534710 [compost metagenome]
MNDVAFGAATTGGAAGAGAGTGACAARYRMMSMSRFTRAKPGSKRPLIAYSLTFSSPSSLSSPSEISDAHSCGSPDISSRYMNGMS